MQDPREPHLATLKRVLRYVRGTTEYGLRLYSQSDSDLIARLMRIRQVVCIPSVLHQAIVYFLVIIYCHGLLHDKVPHPILVLKLNIKVLLMWSLKLVGFKIY